MPRRVPLSVGRHEAAMARVLLAYLRRVGRTVRLTCLDDRQRPCGPEDVARHLAETSPRVLTYLVADSLGVAIAPLSHPALQMSLGAFHVLADMSLGGRITASLIQQMGGSATLLPLPGDAERLHTLREIMTSDESVAFAVDGGGPYGRVGTGIVALAGVLGGSIVPVTALVRPALPLLHRSGVAIPLPGCRVTIAVGAPVAVGRRGDRRAAAGVLERALGSLRVAARGHG